MNNLGEVEVEEEEEEFYESLDRVLSSSCSSTSASDDDGEYGQHQSHRRRSRFRPAPAVSFDLWLSEPGTVEERRRRLLNQMGLAGDHSLARVKLDAEGVGFGTCHVREGEMGRSVSCNGLFTRQDASSVTSSVGAFSRSRSDGSVEHGVVNCQQPPAAGKPPLVIRSRPSVGGGVKVYLGNDIAGFGEEEDGKGCTIKDLDNGNEFVLRDFREDGLWNKVREVGTGKQFTMEEFDACVGSSPIVQELMRRQSVEEGGNGKGSSGGPSKDSVGSSEGGSSKRRSSWLRSLKNVVNTGSQRDRRSSDEKDTSSEKGGRRSSSATDDSQDMPRLLHHGLERMKVRQYGKSQKELTGLYLSQEIQAHSGSIWTIKFSLDGRYLASAGEDCVIHAWQVLEHERRPDMLMDGTGEEILRGNPFPAATSNGSPIGILSGHGTEGSSSEKMRRAKDVGGRKSLSSGNLKLPEQVFALSERPVCSFIGHLDDVLDLSWSKSQYLLSSSMDKTVRLWHLSGNSCLKVFSHSDYVTCIQFNPIDDRFFISGSLDSKVRLWSIPHRQIVDWNDLHEMVTAACYTPDGQGALVGSHKGNCHLYDTSDNKLLQKSQIYLQNKKKKSSHKKITGFQFIPGSSSEVLITSADSRIRVVDGINLIHKFKGFRNTSSQISASATQNGKYIICASEDSHVYVWRKDSDTRPSRTKTSISITQSYEYFNSQDVTAAIPWPNSTSTPIENNLNSQSKPNNNNLESLNETTLQNNAPSPAYSDRVSSTWPEEKLRSSTGKHNRLSSGDLSKPPPPLQSGGLAWGMVIVTASRGGEVRVYQNFGFPVRT
ncbi:WD repeat-containing protein 44-like [Phalaenopsis equestris]|uniref:WD repeat-containing protein 44-like n=1 Tax=Phalaenopsis equestris TaxID=78828 RepID=UPI0009E4BC4B|nr:WD repeat-containing protein 44-like [Phalaenopsis equestris]